MLHVLVIVNNYFKKINVVIKVHDYSIGGVVSFRLYLNSSCVIVIQT